MELNIASEIEKPNKIVSFIKLARLKFLIYSALAYSLGTLICVYLNFQNVKLSAYLLGLFSVWSVHLMTHFCNEYYDLEADKANNAFTNSTGGSRILVNGHLQPLSCLSAGYIFLFFCIVLAVFMPNKASSYVLLTGILTGWFYTAPPFSLNYNRLGELSVATTLSFLVPMMGFSIQTGNISFQMIALLIPAFIFQFTRMLIMNLADYEGDLQVSKFTLTATLGPGKTLVVYGLGQLLGYLILIPLYFSNNIPFSVLIAISLTLPIAVWQFARIKNNGFSVKKTANSITFWASTQSAMIILAIYTGICTDYLLNIKEYNPHQTSLLKGLSVPLVIVICVICGQVFKARASKVIS